MIGMVPHNVEGFVRVDPLTNCSHLAIQNEAIKIPRHEHTDRRITQCGESPDSSVGQSLVQVNLKSRKIPDVAKVDVIVSTEGVTESCHCRIFSCYVVVDSYAPARILGVGCRCDVIKEIEVSAWCFMGHALVCESQLIAEGVFRSIVGVSDNLRYNKNWNYFNITRGKL